MVDMVTTKYYYGKPCKRGHDGLRYSRSRCCVHCQRERAKKFREDNKELKKQQCKEWREKNPSYSSEWTKNNKDLMREYSKKWRNNNRHKHAANERRRRSRKLESVPVWEEDERELINEVYRKARELGSEVDHIVPLRSDIVCGLHCWDNLQILTSEENSSKSNKVWPDSPDDI